MQIDKDNRYLVKMWEEKEAGKIMYLRAITKSI
jgi:hypothetical protein